jgi:Spy/CpxP family protein refolding chaperone
MLTRTVRFALPLALALTAPVVGGCGGTATSEPPATAENAVTRAPVAQAAHGPVKLIGDAFGDVPLTASQRAAIEQMAIDAEARHADARAARKDLMVAIAAQIESGTIDRAALQPKVDAVAAAMQKAQPADRAALEQLHAMLNADQRSAFVDALESRIKGKMGEAKDHHGMKQWAEDLQLSDAQRDQIKSAFQARMQAARDKGEHPWAEMKGEHEHGKKVLEAFKGDRFVMDEVAPAVDVQAKAAKMSSRFLGMAETVLPILTPQQRTLAASKLREKADSTEIEAPGMP